MPSPWGLIPLAVCFCWWVRMWGWARAAKWAVWGLFAGAVFLLMYLWGGPEREGIYSDTEGRVLVNALLAAWLTGCAWLVWVVGRAAIRWIERKYHEETEAGR